MLAGSSVWLKYSLAGDRTGQAVSKPLWLQEEPKDGIVPTTSLSREADWRRCLFEIEKVQRFGLWPRLGGTRGVLDFKHAKTTAPWRHCLLEIANSTYSLRPLAQPKGYPRIPGFQECKEHGALAPVPVGNCKKVQHYGF